MKLEQKVDNGGEMMQNFREIVEERLQREMAEKVVKAIKGNKASKRQGIQKVGRHSVAHHGGEDPE